MEMSIFVDWNVKQDKMKFSSMLGIELWRQSHLSQVSKRLFITKSCLRVIAIKDKWLIKRTYVIIKVMKYEWQTWHCARQERLVFWNWTSINFKDLNCDFWVNLKTLALILRQFENLSSGFWTHSKTSALLLDRI